MAVQPWVQGIVTRIIDETASTKRFTIEVPVLETFDFKPGQFVTIDLPIHEKPNKRWRSYSIASRPDGTNSFELVIVLLEEGLGTPWLWSNVTVGTELTLRGPVGVFTLPENIEKDLYFICTGTGIAPFRSMATHIIAHSVPYRNMYLIFGCRKFADGLYIDELKQLEKENPAFHFIPCYSREEKADGITTGYVHPVYEALVSKDTTTHETENTLQPPGASFYLCGWKNMIDEARQRIAALGYDKKSVHFEVYG
ncbi:MAG: FAD-binding oxidoreductase [Chitinophagaceae bacterium]